MRHFRGAIPYGPVKAGVGNATGLGQVRRRSAYHGCPIGASAVQSRRKTSRGSRPRRRQRRREKANIRANKAVPKRRTQSHAVAEDSLDGYLDGPECDGAGRSDTSCDNWRKTTGPQPACCGLGTCAISGSESFRRNPGSCPLRRDTHLPHRVGAPRDHRQRGRAARVSQRRLAIAPMTPFHADHREPTEFAFPLER